MDAGLTHGMLTGARANARDWQSYAKQLEAALAMSKANGAGMTAVKDAALAELARVDPTNYLLVQQNRQRIFDGAFDPLAGKKS